MAKNTLVIVESAAKAKTLTKFLGKTYKVKASVGHVKDLPKSKLGIDVDNGFEPQYITIRGKGDLLKEIRDEALKAEQVLLATDPDREGEAIAWHLQNVVKLAPNSKCRVEFNEITKDAVKKAVKNPRQIDMDRVDAQQARRVMDRLVGYNLSPLLWSKVKKGLSGGRVQSVVLRLICEREQDINDFKSEEYWTLEVTLAQGKKNKFTARLLSYRGKKLEICDAAQMDEVLRYLQTAPFIVDKVEHKEASKRPHPPFITSTMQQEASKQLKFYAKRTMKVAQELYEGLEIGKEGTVGLITYLRTDSTRVSAQAQAEALDYIRMTHGNQYAPAIPNTYKSKKTAQDAHEAIRPTLVVRTPESVKPFLTQDQYRLYKLIWERFVSSQMTQSLYDTMAVDISAGDYLFRANSSKLKFLGFKKVYNDYEDDEVKNPIPALVAKDKVSLIQTDPEQHFTQPPPRFTEASLIKLLEENNIGRPSTYAPTIDTILKRYYVERQDRKFVPTELGFIIVDLLKNNFSNIIDVEFTANMEENLDRIEEGQLEWKKVVQDFYRPFAQDIERAQEMIEKVEVKDEPAGKDCPICGTPMVIKYGRFGKFMACPAFPNCRHTESINEGTGIECPLCSGNVLLLKSKKGRKFYGCSNYPDCAFRSWNKPTGSKCPVCGDIMIEKMGKGDTSVIICQNNQCKYQPQPEQKHDLG